MLGFFLENLFLLESHDIVSCHVSLYGLNLLEDLLFVEGVVAIEVVVVVFDLVLEKLQHPLTYP